jgi:hypothetical protein
MLMDSVAALYCVNCGVLIKEGETVCKGCGKLGSEIRNELLAMSEKSEDLKCPKCGAPIASGHHYCSSCGAAVR